jgi:hypothetical protein
MAVRWPSAAAGSAVLKHTWYRALMLPIAPGVGRTTTRRPGSIWAMMVSGVLVHKANKERLKPLFIMLDTFHARQSAGVD